MLAKLIAGKMIPCPKQGRDSRGGLHTDLPRFYKANPHRAAEDGVYPVRFTPCPAGMCTMGWTLRDAEIVQVWSCGTGQPEPDDPILASLGRIEACLLQIRGTVCA